MNPLWFRDDIPARMFRGSLIPIAVSGWMLFRLWRAGELFGWTSTVFCVWFVMALLAQVFGESVTVYLIGLIGQVALAIVLTLKQKLSQI